MASIQYKAGGTKAAALNRNVPPKRSRYQLQKERLG